MNKSAIIMAISVLLAFCSISLADELLVPSQYPTIQWAVFEAVDGDTVIVAPGIYPAPENCNIDLSGKAITIRSTNPDDPDIVASTVIDCVAPPNVGFGCHGSLNCTIAGFTIINGSHGIICHQASPTIANCVISGHTSQFGGAGIRCSDSSSPIISNSIITENAIVNGTVSSGSGAGIYCGDNSSPTITNCTITSNSTAYSSPGPGNGGGISCEKNSNPVISYCNISQNTSSRHGGGIYFYRSTPTVNNCIISENIALLGGGLFNDECIPPITNCIISKNHAGRGGGIFGLYSGSITNCTVIGNTAVYGGGIYCHTYSSFDVENCILRSNSPDQIGHEEPGCAEGTPVSYTNIEGGWAGPGNIDSDPCFADPDANDFHLKSEAGRWDPSAKSWIIDTVTSPCIDAGSTASPIAYEPFPNGGRINMGAYGGTEYASKSYFGTSPCQVIMAGDINGDCTVDFTDFAILSGHWLWKE
jgi:parallel beta-helix repeat protein/predicted outer membrane repeat protein